MNPEALTEFNFNANINGNMTYEPTFNKSLGHTGSTWVGAPYIELVTNDTEPDCPYTFKLRFRTITKNTNNTTAAKLSLKEKNNNRMTV